MRVDFEAFRSFLESKGLSKRWIRDLERYTRRYVDLYAELLAGRGVEEFERLQPGAREKVLAAFSWLSRFLGIEEQWVPLRRRLRGWRRRLQPPPLLEEPLERLVGSISRCAKLLSPPRFRVFLAFVLASGLRPSEAAYAWRRYWVLRRTTARGAIVLFLNMSRRTKHALLALVHPRVDERVPRRPSIGLTNLRKRWNTVCDTLYGKRITLYMLRRLHATLLLRAGLREWEVDLLQGRLEGLTRRHYILYSIDDIWPRYIRALEEPLRSILS